MTPSRILVAIPCYRCERQISRVLETFNSALLDRIEKILLIDNRSPDGTLEAAKQAARRLPRDKVELVLNDDNFGLGGSHKVAFLRGIAESYTHVAILHGDNQARTEELALLLDDAVSHPKAAAILGARFLPASRLNGYSKLRIAGNLALNALYSAASLRPTFDLGSGLNLFRLRELSDKSFLGFSNGFTFNMDLLLDYYRKGASVRFVPITWSETDQVSNAKTFKVGWATLKTLVRWRVARPIVEPNRAYASSKVAIE